MLAPLAELAEFRLLLGGLVARDLRVRYRRSVLGVLWAFIEPLALLGLFTFVFGRILRVDVPRYPVFALTGIVVWGFMQTGVTYSLSAVTQNAALVKKIYFPREILPAAVVLGRGVHFCISLGLLVPFLVFFRVPVGAAILWLPLIMAIQLVFVLGLSLWLSGFATLYDDVNFLVTFGFNCLFYLSPVVYPASLVPRAMRGVYDLNPVATLLAAYRPVLLDASAPALEPLLWAGAAALALFVTGLAVFRRLAWRFAEVL